MRRADLHIHRVGAIRIRRQLVDAEQRRGVRRKRIRQRASGNDHRKLRIRHDPPQPLGRILGIERNVRATRAQHAQDGRNQLRAALQQHADAALRADAQGDQPAGDAIRALIQLGVGQRLAAPQQRRGAGSAARLRLDQRVDGVRGTLRIRRVPLIHHLLAFRVVQQRETRQAHGGIGGDLLQDALQVAQHPLDRRRVEQVGDVADGAAQAVIARRQH
jgi:hypothetical protein